MRTAPETPQARRQPCAGLLNPLVLSLKHHISTKSQWGLKSEDARLTAIAQGIADARLAESSRGPLSTSSGSHVEVHPQCNLFCRSAPFRASCILCAACVEDLQCRACPLSRGARACEQGPLFPWTLAICMRRVWRFVNEYLGLL